MNTQALYLARDVRRLDQIVIEQFGVPGYELMVRAGSAAFAQLRWQWPRCKKITLLCGRGNNAGDGYVVAKLAHQAGFDVEVVTLADLTYLQGDALTAARDAVDAGVAIVHENAVDVAARLAVSDVLVDALFGTGLDRPIEGRWWNAIRAINDSDRPVLALDVPSGLNADTGGVWGIAVEADCTVTFIANKQGLHTAGGRRYCGRIHLATLDAPQEAYRQIEPTARLIQYTQLARDHFKPRHANSHKGEHGHVLLIGGEAGFSGALRLAGEAALRCGAGLVSLATRARHAALLSVQRPELMSHGVESQVDLAPLLTHATVVAIGPGLGQGEWGQAMFTALLERKGPLVVDADALNWLAREPHARNDWVLTPHPGEAARLLGVTAKEIEHDRFHAVRELQRRYGGIFVLKGAGSLLCYGEGVLDVCGDGNPGMAVGGMGDVLTGVLASLLAQGLAAAQAVPLGVCLHSAAADCAAKTGQRGMLASDLFAHFRQLINPQSSGL